MSGQDQLDSTTKRTIMENEQMAGALGGVLRGSLSLRSDMRGATWETCGILDGEVRSIAGANEPKPS